MEGEFMKLKLDEALVVGDIAGNFKTLQALLEKAKVPLANVISVGDIVDRGPASKEVVKFLRDNSVTTILGNHELMMIEDYEACIGTMGDWGYNGGVATLESFDLFIPQDVIGWMKGLPVHVELECGDKKYYLSHAPVGWPNDVPPDDISPVEKTRRVWNRRPALDAMKDTDGKQLFDLQIFGHNSHFGLKYIGNPPWSVCIDTSASDVLTGIHLPTGTIFQQEYID